MSFWYHKKRFLEYSSPVILIGRKVTKDKKAVNNFRQLNAKTAQNNLVCPALKKIVSNLGSYRDEVFSVLVLKDAVYLLILSEIQKHFVEFYHIL